MKDFRFAIAPAFAPGVRLGAVLAVAGLAAGHCHHRHGLLLGLRSRAAGNWNVAMDWALPDMSVPNIAKPLARAINIYRSMTRHDLDTRTQRDLARHMKAVAEQGTQDPGRLTVHGLSYLRARERKSKEHKE